MKSNNHQSLLQTLQLFAVSLLLLWPMPNRAQTVVATVPVQGQALAVAANPVTNEIYVASWRPKAADVAPEIGSVTVIDGQTNTASAISTIFATLPVAVAVNPVTNKIYVADSSRILVIDGVTNSSTTVADSHSPVAVAVNSETNKIYLANPNDNANPSASVTVLDGATNSITTIADPNADGLSAVAIAVNLATNKIYVANRNTSGSGTSPGNITVIDGDTNATTTVTDPNAISPQSVAVNSATNKIYVANEGDYPGLNHGNITVIDGATNSITTLTDPNALDPLAVAVNQITNKIYVANGNDSALTGKGGVSVIDGVTNAISFVSDPNGYLPHTVAVDSGTNTIYIANQGCYPPADKCSNPGSVTVINGQMNDVTTVIDPNASHPAAVAVNPATDKIYVANGSGFSGNVSVIDGGATPTSHILSLLLAGNGTGTVTSNPAGIDCTTSCTASFAAGTAVSLTASPASGSTFSGWSTSCTGTGTCNLTMTSDDFLIATFKAPDFSLQPASAHLTTQRGAQVTDIITISPVNGSVSDAVQLSCTVSTVNGSTAPATCSLSPTSVTPAANSVTSTLTVTVPSQPAELIAPSEAQLSSHLYAVFLPIPLALIGLGLTSSKLKQRRHPLWLVCSLLIVFVALQAGCGGGSNSPPLKYAVTVTATSGAIQHSAQVTLTVQ